MVHTHNLTCLTCHNALSTSPKPSQTWLYLPSVPRIFIFNSKFIRTVKWTVKFIRTTNICSYLSVTHQKRDGDIFLILGLYFIPDRARPSQTQRHTPYQSRPSPQDSVCTSDVNRKQKIWYTKKIPIPNRYLVFLSQISRYFLGILSVFWGSPC